MTAIISNLEEITRETLIEKLGENNISSDPVMVVAGRIAEVSINPELLDPAYLAQLKVITLPLFDNSSFQVYLDKSTFYRQSISLRGSMAESSTAVFFLSMTEKQVWAALRIPDERILFIIKYVQLAGKHYLFQADITEVERYECEVLMPPEQE